MCMAAMCTWTVNIATSVLIVLWTAFVQKFARWMVCRENDLYMDTIATGVRVSENLKNGVHDLSKAIITIRAPSRANKLIVRAIK